MNARTFDIMLPVLYALAVGAAFLVGDETVLGAVAVVGAVALAAYFTTLRRSGKS